ncbi:MAG: hypothetical protein B1H03_02940 [Planctomycetales bacterium 4484_113]|nr:MAG: hypothetical protein B1H03_02940 [Planctomycetales bacterium 4484_113]
MEMRMKNVCIIGVVSLLLPLLIASGCKMNPESQRAVTKKVQVPGMAESLKARDMAIAAAIQVSFASDVELAQNKLEIEVKRCHVILRGKVPTDELKKRAEQYAKDTENVIDVVNEIEVDPSLKERRFSLDE